MEPDIGDRPADQRLFCVWLSDGNRDGFRILMESVPWTGNLGSGDRPRVDLETDLRTLPETGFKRKLEAVAEQSMFDWERDKRPQIPYEDCV